LYTRADIPGGMAAVPAEPPASVAGQGVLQGLGPFEQAFIAGKHLAMYRREHQIKMLFPTTTELTVILFAAIRLVEPNTPAPREYLNQVTATTQALGQYIRPMPMQFEALKVEVRRFLKEGARANIRKWSQTVETTAARAGLLLAGDLDVARRVLMSERQIPGDLSPQERMDDLLNFSVSEKYFNLRKTIGIAIQPE
ncbi:MAG: hypothetical protein AAGA56_12515, partial [Myxococcota bacterium]